MQLRRFVLPASVALTLMAASPALARNYFVRAGSTEAGTCTIDNGDHACSLEFAVHDAHFGDEITMAPGNYVLTQALEVPTRLLIHGAVGQPRPVISLNDANSAVTMNVLPFGTVLRHLEFTSSLVTGATVSLHDTTVEDTIIHATSPGTSAAVISDGTALRNTVIKMDGPDTDGVIALRATEELRNVTISGVDGSGDAITARCFDEPGATADSGGSINVINTIVAARGPNALFADGSNCDHGYKPTIAASSSSFDPLKVHRTAGGTYNEGADNVGPSSLAADGIHELAGSVSIDAGKVDALSPIDIDGEPRVQGKAVDIGADEFVPPPPPVVTPSAPAAPAPLPAPIKPTILNIPAIPPGLSGLTATGTRTTSKTPPIIHFTLSAAQKFNFKISALLSGRIRKGKCVSPAGKTGARCTSVRPILSGSIAAAAGHNDVGLLTAGSRNLSPGHYRVTLYPAGQAPQSTEFRVLSAKKK